MGIKEYLESKGFDVISIGDNWNIDCPLCDDERKRLGFKMSTGQWNCFNCEAKGSFKRFQKVMKDERVLELNLEKEKTTRKISKLDQGMSVKFYNKLELKNRLALPYLQEARGFKRSTIDHFQLGSWLTKGHEYVSIPFWKQGKLVNIKFRAVIVRDKKYKWRRIKNGESSLFHDDICDNQKYQEVFLCEAELDAISLYNAGFKNVVAATTGAKKFQQEWYERLERFKKIYIVYDNDVDGQAGAEKMATRLGMDRCFNIRLPSDFKDVNEYFWDKEQQKKRHRKVDFLKLAKDARRFEVRDTMSLQYALKEVYKDIYLNDEEELYGFRTPWAKVNRVMRGAKKGHLVVVSAKPKTGKTTWVLNWMKYLSETGTPTAIYCCEMKQKKIARRMVGMYCKDFVSSEYITGSQVAEANYGLPSKDIYLGYPKEDSLTLDNIAKWIKEVVARYGVKFVCFDNLHYLIRGESVKDRVGEVTRRFKLLAETLGIVFCLVVHPRKVGDKIMTADDLKDSSSTYQDLDTLIILHRGNEEGGDDDESVDDDFDFDNDAIALKGKYSPMTEIHIEGRDIDGGKIFLYYQGERGLFFETGNMYERAVKRWKAKKEKGKTKHRRGQRVLDRR